MPPAVVDGVASWRRLPEDPVSAARWIFRWGKRFHRFDWFAFFASVLSFGAMVGTLYASRAKGEDVGQVLAVLAIAPVAAVLGAWKFRRSDTERHASLPTVAGNLEAIPVCLEIRHKGRLTGRETGWVTFADGWLVYEGVRTEFSLKPQDVFGSCRDGQATELDMMDYRRVKLSPLESDSLTQAPARKEDRDRLERQVAEWQRGVSPSGRSILPPRAPHPEVMGNAIGYGIALFIASTLMICAGPLNGSIAGPILFGIVAAMSLLWVFWRSGVFRRELPSMID